MDDIRLELPKNPQRHDHARLTALSDKGRAFLATMDADSTRALELSLGTIDAVMYPAYTAIALTEFAEQRGIFTEEVPPKHKPFATDTGYGSDLWSAHK